MEQKKVVEKDLGRREYSEIDHLKKNPLCVLLQRRGSVLRDIDRETDVKMKLAMYSHLSDLDGAIILKSLE